MAKKYERFIKTYSSEKILQTSEIWVDKETGMPLRTINRGGVEEHFPGTDVVKEVRDNIKYLSRGI